MTIPGRAQCMRVLAPLKSQPLALSAVVVGSSTTCRDQATMSKLVEPLVEHPSHHCSEGRAPLVVQLAAAFCVFTASMPFSFLAPAGPWRFDNPWPTWKDFTIPQTMKWMWQRVK